MQTAENSNALVSDVSNAQTRGVLRKPSHGHGMLRNFEKGVSGNPSGSKGHEWSQVLGYCRSKSLEASEKLGELMHDKDPRVALMACKEIIERAWGKPREMKDEPGDKRMFDPSAYSTEELKLLLALLRRGFDAKTIEGESK